MVLRLIACLAAICVALDCHSSQAVRCLNTLWGTSTECEGSFCGASYYVLPTDEETWVYKCIDDAIPQVGSCMHPYVLYQANHTRYRTLFRHVFDGCCSSDWCSNQTSALTMPPEYQQYLQTLETSSPVQPIPASSVPELETGRTTSTSPPESPISITVLPSVNIGISGTKMTVVLQSSGGGDATSTSDVATATSDVAPTCTDISTSTVVVQPSGKPSSSPSSGDMDYATLSFVLIILVCFLICVIVVMFVAMVIWWVVWYRRLADLTKFTEFKLQIE